MALANYITQVQRLLHDPQATYYPTTDLTAFINLARGQVAIEGQCVRTLLPSTNGISAITVTAAGTGYLVAPTVTITGTGTGATATAILSGTTVSSVMMTAAGSGYDNTTVVTLDVVSGGSGATATPTIICNNTVVGQEVYTFASLAAVAQLRAGVQGVIALRSVAVSWGSLKPMLEPWVWSDFQAYLRSNNNVLKSCPAVWALYGQGGAGSIYVYPLPSTIAQWDWDTVCYPVDLVDDSTTEVIPYPWTDAVQYYGAYLAYDNSQRKADADRMFATYERFMKRAQALSQTDFVPDPYEHR